MAGFFGKLIASKMASRNGQNRKEPSPTNFPKLRRFQATLLDADKSHLAKIRRIVRK